jgi:ABC-type hemin transport system substrate-binding protein
MPAVRDGRVLVIREDAIFRAGPRIPEAIEVLERLLYATGTKPK